MTSEIDRCLERILETEPEFRCKRIREIAAGRTDLEAKLRDLLHHYTEAEKEGCFEEPMHQIAVELLSDANSPDKSSQQTESFRRIGNYQLLEQIGEGGMGAVYRALHINLSREVAIKVLLPRHTNDPAVIERFDREIKTIGGLDHENIVAPTDAGKADGVHFLAMELIDGVDLQSLCERIGSLPYAEACAIIHMAARGLQHAHSHGVIHRDLKPSNLMLTRDAKVKILDLGLASLRSQEDSKITQSGQLLGTPSYMSPEQVKDPKSIDHRSDIFSLGATLYSLLTGLPPFSGCEYNTPGKVLVAIATQSAPPIETLCPEIPEALSRVIAQAMARDPENRYSTSAELAEALLPFTTNAELQAISVKLDHRQARREASATSTEKVQRAPDETKRTAKPIPKKRRPHPPVPRRVGVWLILLAIAGGFAFIIRFEFRRNKDGSIGGVQILLAENCPPEVQLELTRTDNFVQAIRIQKDHKQEFKIAAGNYRLKLSGLSEEVCILENDTITIQANMDSILRVRRRHPWLSAKVPEVIEHWNVEPLDPAVAVSAIAIHPNGDVFACATAVGQIQVRRMQDFGLEHFMRSQHCDVAMLRWRPDGRVLLSGHKGGWLRWWSLNGELLRELDGNQEPVLGVAWSKDGARCAVARATEVEIYAANGQLIRTLAAESQLAGGIAWSPTGGSLAIGYRGAVKLLRLTTPFTTYRTINTDPTWRCSLSWSRAGLVLADERDEKLTIVDVETGGQQPVALVGYSKSASWLPDGGLFTFGKYGAALLNKDFELQRRLRVQNCAFADLSPSSPAILGASADEIVRFDQESLVPAKRLAARSSPSVSCISWAPDGKQFAVATSTGRVALIQRDGVLAKQLPAGTGIIRAAKWSRDNRFLAVSDESDDLRVFGSDGHPAGELNLAGGVGAIAWKTDAATLAVAAAGSKSIIVWSPASGAKLELDLPAIALSLAWSNDGKSLIAGLEQSKGIRLWRFGDNQPTHMLDESMAFRDYVAHTVFTPNGKTVVGGGAYGKLAAVDCTGKHKATQLLGHETNIVKIAMARDSGLLAASSDDGRVSVRQINSPNDTKLYQHQAGSPKLAWSCDDSLLAIGGAAGDLAMLRPNFKVEARLPGHIGGINCMDWKSNSANEVTVGTTWGTVWHWDVKNRRPLFTILLRGHDKAIRFSGAGNALGADQIDLDYLRESCMVRIIDGKGALSYAPYTQFEKQLERRKLAR